MAKLGEMARLIRSKNAGPFELTFDIMFDDKESFQRVFDSNALSRQLIADLYRVPQEDWHSRRPFRGRGSRATCWTATGMAASSMRRCWILKFPEKAELRRKIVPLLIAELCGLAPLDMEQPPDPVNSNIFTSLDKQLPKKASLPDGQTNIPRGRI
jgi:hypothetical protein